MFASRARRRRLVLLRAARPRRRPRSPTLGCVARLDRGRRPSTPAAAHARASPPRGRRVAPARRRAPWPTRPTGRPAPGSSPSAASRSPPTGGAAPHWAGFGAGGLVVPELALARRGRDVRLTVAALAAPDDVPEELVARARAAARRGCASGRCRCSTPRRPGASGSPRPRRPSTTRRRSPAPSSGSAPARSRRSCWPARSPCTRRRRTTPRRCSACCAPASRPATSTAPAAATPRSSARRPSCWSAARGCAPPPWRSPARRAARPTPPSTRTSASSCCSSEKDREEQAIVTRRIARALRPLSVWVAAPDEPAIVRVANIQHLATPIRAQLTQPRSVVELAGLLHPTPAVGGRAARGGRAADPGVRGPRPRLVRRAGRLDRRQRGRRVLRRAALRAAARRRGAALRRRRRRARLRPRGRAGRDRGQARRAAAGPLGLSGAALAPDLEHLAHARRAVGDARVQRADDQLEAAGLELLELGHQRVEPRPFLSTSTMSPAPMPFDVWRARRRGGLARGSPSAVPVPSPGNARRRPGRPPRRARCSATFSSRSVRTWISVGAGRRRARASSAARNGSGAATRSCASAVERGGVREVEAVRRGDVLLERGALAGDRAGSRRCRRRRCRAARSRAAGRAGARRAARRRRARARRRRSAARPGPGAAAATPNAVETVPSMPFAPRLDEHARRVRAGGEERLDVADRHRGGDDERRLGRQAHAQLGGDARLAELGPRAEHAGDRAGRGAVGRRSTPPASRGRAACAAAARRAPRATARGSAGSSVATAPAGSCHAFSGSNAICSVSLAEPGEPLAQRLGGRQVADAQHELGPPRRAERGIAQQRVVVRDRGRAAARARRRLGQQRHARRARRTRPARRRAAGRAPRGRRRRAARGRRSELAGERVDERGVRPRRVRPGRVTHGRPPARPPPPGSSAGSGASSTSGSRSEKFRCTGPGRPSSAVQNARQASWRSQRTRSGVAGWSSTSRNHFAAPP